MHVYVGLNVCLCTIGAHVPVGDRRGHQILWKLEIQVVVNCLIWELRNKSRPSAKTASYFI